MTTMTSAATKRVFLVGFMGAGKTTLGSWVARELGVPFFDLDERIEQETGTSVASIFRREGEPSFRRRESDALRALLAEAESGVIALGGGTFTFEHNRELVQAAGDIVWLDVPFDELHERVEEGAPGSRPLWQSPERARSLHAGRSRTYALADHRLDLGGLSSDEARTKLLHLLSSILR